MKTINKLPLILLLLLISQIKLSGQEILDYVEMSGKFGGIEVINQKDVIKTVNGDYYIRMTGLASSDFYIDGDTLSTLNLPDSIFTYDFTQKTVVAHVDKNLNVLNTMELVNAGKFYSTLAVSSDRVFVSYDVFDFNPNIMVNDSIILTSGDEAGILEFDMELNLLGRKRIANNFINNMIASDTILYYERELNEEYGSYVIEGDTVYNYFVEGPNGEKFFGDKTPLFVRYDYHRDTIESYWQLGSMAWDRIFGLELDEEENLLITGHTQSLGGITLDNINVLPTAVSASVESFTGKYDKSGNLLYGFTTPNRISDLYNHSVSDDTGSYFRGYFRGDSVVVAQDTIYENGSYQKIRALAVKIDNEGNEVWGYSFSGEVLLNFFRAIAINNNRLYLALSTFDGFVTIQDNYYSIPSNTSFIIVLNPNTGEELNHIKFETGEGGFWISQIEEINEDILRLMVRIDDQIVVGDDILGNDGLPTYYFMDVSIDFLSAINNLIKDEYVKIYPNPIQSNELFHIESLDVDYDHYILYNMAGELMQQGNLDMTNKSDTIQLNKMNTGVYCLMLIDKNNRQTVQQIMVK